MEAFKGIDGLDSMKRWIGFILAIGMLGIATVSVISDPAGASEVLWPIGSVVAITMGATALERLKK